MLLKIELTLGHSKAALDEKLENRVLEAGKEIAQRKKIRSLNYFPFFDIFFQLLCWKCNIHTASAKRINYPKESLRRAYSSNENRAVFYIK